MASVVRLDVADGARQQAPRTERSIDDEQLPGAAAPMLTWSSRSPMAPWRAGDKVSGSSAGVAQRERPQRVSIGAAWRRRSNETPRRSPRMLRPSQRTTPAACWRRCRGAPRRRPRPARPEPRSCAVDEEHPVLVLAASGGGVIGLQAAAGRSTPRSTTTSVSSKHAALGRRPYSGPMSRPRLIGPPARSSTSEAGSTPRSASSGT